MTEKKDANLDIGFANPEVGQSYPLYGMITNFISEEPGKVVLEVNSNMILQTTIDRADKIELLKQRSFEAGIFITTVTKIENGLVYGDCTTIVFGNKKNFDA